jgi:hypothetical protein
VTEPPQEGKQQTAWAGPPPGSRAEARTGPWGPWATLGFSLVRAGDEEQFLDKIP